MSSRSAGVGGSVVEGVLYLDSFMFMYELCVIIISRSVIVIHNLVPLGLFFAYNYANFLCRIHQLHRFKLERLRRNPLNIPKNLARGLPFVSSAS